MLSKGMMNPTAIPYTWVALQVLDAASVVALPEAVRLELEGIEDSGGVQFLQEMSTQIKVRCKPLPLYMLNPINAARCTSKPPCL